MAGSIIPPVGTPGIAPNLSEVIWLDADRTVASSTILYSTTTDAVFRNQLVFDYAGLRNAGALWNITTTSPAAVVSSFNFGAIENTGLMVAQSATSNARGILVASTWTGGLNNSGRIFAIAPQASAVTVMDWSPGVPIINSGVLAAQGLVAHGIFRTNGGRIENLATGRILAEGARAVAIYLEQGHLGFPDDPDITNAGEIIANRAEGSQIASIGLLLVGVEGQTMFVVNSGLIAADIAIYVDEQSFSPDQHNAERIVNEASGIIRGAIDLAGGDNILINRGLIEGDIFVGGGDDFIDMSAGHITGFAELGFGDDRYLGSAGVDRIAGDRGNDDLRGFAEADLLLGGRGDDLLDGGAGRDGLYGEFGDDTLIVSGGDAAYGGVGNDRFVVGDYTFALLDGGDGDDTLVLPESVRILSLAAMASSGRVLGFERIVLPGAQTLVVGAADIAALTGGQRLFVSLTASGGLALIGAWTMTGTTTVAGQPYNTYTLGAAEVLVAGGGNVSVQATAPTGATGLDAIEAGPLAPLPGEAAGIALTQSVTNAEAFTFYRSLVLEADEQWISNTGYASIRTGNDRPLPGLTNHGQIITTGQQAGAVALFGDFEYVYNQGRITASAGGSAQDLAANKAHLALYGLTNTTTTLINNVFAYVAIWGPGAFLNAGEISAFSQTAMAIGLNYYAPFHFENTGDILADSEQFIGIGLYAHNGGKVTNTGTITAEGDFGAYGVGASTHQFELDNQGLIVARALATDAVSVGVEVYWQAGPTTITNSGVIDSDVAIRSYRTTGGGPLSIYNSGQLIGRIDLDVDPLNGVGQDDYVFNTGTITGDVRLGGSRDIFDGLDGAQAGVIFGEQGNDALYGGVGDDKLDGGEGNDLLRGSQGADRLAGGAGRDIFLYRQASDSTGTASDLITDFESGVDVIDMSALAPSNISFSVSGGQTTITAQTSTGQVLVRVNGAVSLGDILTTPSGSTSGTSGADTLLAAATGSALFGLGGDDLLIGGAGNDQLHGGADSNVVVGGAGNDTYFVGEGTDIIREFAGEGDDTIIADGAYEVTMPPFVETLVMLSGGSASGNELGNHITGNDGPNFMHGFGGDDEIHAGGFTDIVDGNDGDDALYGDEGDDWLRGGTGNDNLHGGDGDDILDGGIGSDVYDGGVGSDTVNYGDEIIQERIVVDLSISGYHDTGAAGLEWLLNIENISGSLFNDWIKGSLEANRLDGGAGDDHLLGAGGDDTLFGGSGDDRLEGGDGDDFLASFLFAGNVAGAGDGNDSYIGGAGSDTVSYAYSINFSGVSVNLALAGPQDTGGAGVDTMAGIENLIGTQYADSLAGDASSNRLSGGRGDDQIFGGLGNDTLLGGDDNDLLDGGAGSDIVSYAEERGAVTISLALTGPQQVGLSGLDTLVSIEGLEGSSFNDTLTGGAGNNTLSGLDGDDVLSGGLGADTLLGGGGNDALNGDEGIDTASYASATQRVVVDLSLAGAQNTLSAGLDALVAIENLVGSAFGDTLTGDAGNNTLIGGAGVDTLIGGLGDDTLIGGDNTDFIVDTAGVVSIDGGGGNEQITLGAGVVSGTVDGGVGTDSLTKGGSIAGLVLTSIEILNSNGGTVTGTAGQFEGFDTIRFSIGQPSTAVSLALSAAGAVDLADELLGRRVIFAGTSGNDAITTSTGSDQIDGGAGDDVLSGGLGNDTLIGGLGDDQLNGGDGTDFLVDLSGVLAVDGGAGDDVITLGAALNAGTVAGGLGSDQLNKGGTIAGLAISGIEIVNTNGGTLTATAAQLEGFDTIRFSAAQSTTAVSLALAAAGTVDLVDELLGRRALFAGSSGNDVITTSNGSDQIDGGAGDDTLVGNGGVDTLIGGLGDDSLSGGDGGDFLVDLAGSVAIDAGDGDDTLTVGALVTTGTIAGGLGTGDQLNKSGNLSAITVSGIETLNTNGGTLTATAAQLEGFDTIRFSASQATATISLAQADAGAVDLADEVLGRRVLYQGSSGNDVVTLSDGNDRLDGGAGDDTLNGGLGNDAVSGGIGADLIVQGSTDGRDIIDGGAGVDTYRLVGTAAAETFRIMTRAEAVLAGITGLAGSTEIVITRNGTDTASVIAELDNIEEIEIDSFLATANNGNGVLESGASGGDTIIVSGDFTTTSLDYSTISITGSAGNDTIDISGLTSAHRVVFASNGGADTVIGTPRPQDVFGLHAFGVSDGIDALAGVRAAGGRWLAPELPGLSADDTIDALMLQAMLDMPDHDIGRTMIDTQLDQQPLEMTAQAAPLQHALGDQPINLHDTRIVPTEMDYLLG